VATCASLTKLLFKFRPLLVLLATKDFKRKLLTILATKTSASLSEPLQATVKIYAWRSRPDKKQNLPATL